MSWKRVSNRPSGTEWADWYSFKDYWFVKVQETQEIQMGVPGTVTMLEPVVVPKQIVIAPEYMFPTTIVPPLVTSPASRTRGSELGGGQGQPWSNGPKSLLSLPTTIGTLLFYIGARVAVSLAIRGANDLYGALKVKYHQRNAYVKVHTGVGKAESGAPNLVVGRRGPAVVPTGAQVPLSVHPSGAGGAPLQVTEYLEYPQNPLGRPEEVDLIRDNLGMNIQQLDEWIHDWIGIWR